MRIMTVLGTRPEIIRLSLVIPMLDRIAEHVLVHTGQNYDERLDQVFFRELEVRAPDANLGVRGSFGEQVGAILSGVERLLLEHKPDRLLILGDTNSGLSAIVARRMGVPVYHMEAGNRCYDDRVPEEVNRRLIDHSSSILMPYTNRSRENLLREGFEGERIYTIGNPIKEVIDRFSATIAKSDVIERLELKKGKYFLVTMHRAENVDDESRLRDITTALGHLSADYDLPVICSTHPRTASRIEKYGIDTKRTGLRMLKPMGFFDFIQLEQSAFCCLSDSGTVQEETCIFGVPNVTMREVTERPETVECGSNILAGTNAEAIVRSVSLATSTKPAWTPPKEYLEKGVAETTCRILTSFRPADRAELDWRAGSRL
jgi:UDP-N-acetylglucosamine 2-epimerase (non-hydrolysing)